ISYDRILKMLVVHDDRLMIEEKGIYSTEKFLVARRLMYWQVYLHKAVMSAEMLLVKIIRRAKELLREGIAVPAATKAFDFFLSSGDREPIANHLETFCRLDDYDVMCTVKNWMDHPDMILSMLCRDLVNRVLFKIRLQSEPFDVAMVEEEKNAIAARLGISNDEAGYFVFTGEVVNTTYDGGDERINVLFRDGSVTDISKIDNALVQQQLSGPVKKYYFCQLR
ncbi:MAG TPA: phosphohydrolase, partial [Chitinophagaceae bacterium]